MCNQKRTKVTKGSNTSDELAHKMYINETKGISIIN